MSVKISIQEKLFSVATVTVAVALLAYLFSAGFLFDFKALLIFGILTFTAENFCINLPRGGAVSVSSTIIMASILIFGPLIGAAAPIFTAIVWKDVKERTSPFWWLFNGSQGVIGAGIAGLVYVGLGGRLLHNSDGFLRGDFPGMLLPLVLAAITFFLINSVLVSLSISLAELVSPLIIWRSNILWSIPNYFSLVPLALAFAQIYMLIGVIGLFLMVIPLLVARQTFQVYGRLKNTYLETVKALVAALEAKDPYTRGHSERVAKFAVMIGRRLNLDAESLEIISYAGVLHDIGKIGTARHILRKPGKLTVDEYNRIKQHPESGALILQEIKFMEKVIPAVFHHHEHYNGSGYIDGFKGEEIPHHARILAVADAYDAMISPRPYRPAMSEMVACRELLTCSGSQFDPGVVNAFIEVLGIDLADATDQGLKGQLRLDELFIDTKIND